MKKLWVALLMLVLSLGINAEEIKLTSDNTVSLSTSFSSKSIGELKRDLLKLDSKLKSGYPIYLVLNTPGGSVQAGLELYEFVNGLNRPVHTITLFAASMGFQTVQNLGNRYILKFGVLMSHKARGGFKGEFGGGLSQLDARYNMWLKRIDMLDKTTVKRTKGKQTLQSYRASYDNELWLNGPEAVSLGYADEIATVSCSSDLASATVVKSKNFGFFSVKAKVSKCPIITAPLSIKAEILTNKGYMELNKFLESNGKFGVDCENLVTEMGEPVEDGLCAYDKKLNMGKVQKALMDQENFLNRNLKDHVEYSY